jgi:hypothetical protein
MKAKTITCAAIVSKLKPKLTPKDIYSLKDAKDMRISKEEKIIRVEIREV